MLSLRISRSTRQCMKFEVMLQLLEDGKWRRVVSRQILPLTRHKVIKGVERKLNELRKQEQ